MTVDLRHELEAELRGRVADAIHPAIVAALGGLPTGATPLAALPAISGWYVNYGDDVMALYAVTGTRLVRYELSADGRSLTTVVPVNRIARVAESNDGTTVRLLVEIDADRRAFSLSGRMTTVAGDDAAAAGEQVSLGGELLSAGWIVEAPVADAAALMRFATLVRAAI